MRASGVVLIVLIFGHLFVNLVAGEGVNAIDFAFVAGKLADPFWVVWDTLLLWLALIHGANGIRTIINDYANNPLVRRILLGAVLVSTIVLLTLGTLVIYTFDPCPAGAPADLLPSFCPVP
jgi:succinate dehydrogenase / fumarate reductase membrane anchor subunit